MALFFFVSDRSFKDWAYRCTRCGKILCSKCEKHILWGHMCLQCYRSMVRIEELDAKERIARLLAVYEHRQKRRSVIKFISFLLPGVGPDLCRECTAGLPIPVALSLVPFHPGYEFLLYHRDVGFLSCLA